MTQLNEIYKCNVCGNIVEVLHTGAGELVCCGQPMQLMKENTVDASKEKHVPVIEENKIKVGSEPHPMTEEHHIEWIEAVYEDGARERKFLKPGDQPEFESTMKIKSARAYCNLHELWKS